MEEELEGRQKRDLQDVCVTSRRRLRHWGARGYLLAMLVVVVRDSEGLPITVRMKYTGMIICIVR